MTLQRSTIQLLRFHFSLFLLPVFLFALSQSAAIDLFNALLLFAILHLLVYPSSNGFNSYMDRDAGPIGGLAAPLQPTKQLFYVTVLMDIAAVLLAVIISPLCAAGICLYIAASRAYSHRSVRLKKYPIAGFFTVFFFQGALIYCITYHSVTGTFSGFSLLASLLASLLIGALYPLTQVYQHTADKNDGVETISMKLGKRGSFLFSMLQFLGAAAGFYILFSRQSQENHFYLFLLFTLPVVLYFLYWMQQVWRDERNADFRNSLRMNILATLCTTALFITLTIRNH